MFIRSLHFWAWLFLCGLFLSVSFAHATSAVRLNYPGWVIEDTKLPGIPSTNVRQYRTELELWATNYNVPLSHDFIQQSINMALPIGYESNIQLAYRNSVIPIADITIAQQMRDIIFLESLQNSIKHWEKDFIEPMGSASGASLRAAGTRAESIYNQFLYYTRAKGFTETYNNPVLNALLGTGSTSYFNILTSDGFIEGLTDTAIQNVIFQYGTGFTLGDIISKTDVAELGVGFVNSVLSSSGVIDRDTSFLINTTSTAAFGLVSGGLGMVMAPGTIYKEFADYVYTSLNDSAKSAYLVNYYYFISNYADYSSEFLNLDGGLKDFYSMKTDAHGICSNNVIMNDSVATALCNFNYSSGYFAPERFTRQSELISIYALANTFALVKGINLEKIKKELVARVYLEELKQRSFTLIAQDLSVNSSSAAHINRYRVTVPFAIRQHAEHGTAVSVEWTVNNLNVFSIYPEAVSDAFFLNGNDDLPYSFEFDLKAYEDLNKNLTISVVLQFADGAVKQSNARLRFVPQLHAINLLEEQSDFSNNIMDFSVLACGDLVAEGIFQYRKQGDHSWLNHHVHLVEPETAASPGCSAYKLAAKFGSGQFFPPFGPLEYRIAVANLVSVTKAKVHVDPNDLDGDGLPDAWEMQYFGHLDYGPDDDPDEDGFTNLQEFINGTDPTQAGTAGIINRVTFKPYRDHADQLVSTFNPSGTIWAHVHFEGGVIDLQGRTLVIEGDLIHSGGTFILNGGELIVKGDYRVQSRSTEGVYGSSTGRLTMTDARDVVLVQGDFVMQSNVSHNELLMAGVLEVQGNFTQLTVSGIGASWTNFQARGTHKVVLSGTKQQTISFASTQSGFNTLIHNNDNNTLFNGHVRITHPEQFRLAINLLGNRRSLVVSDDEKLVCGTECAAFYERDHVVKLRAEAASGDVFRGWPEQCVIEGDQCHIAINQVTELDLSFALKRRRSNLLKILAAGQH